MKGLIYIVIGLPIVGFLIFGLIEDPKNTMQLLSICVIPIVALYSGIKLNKMLLKKNKFAWEDNPVIKKICGWLCFVSWFVLVIGILFLIMDIWQITYRTIAYFLFCTFSFWAYLSVILARPYALLLLRTYLIFIIFSLMMILTVDLFKTLTEVVINVDRELIAVYLLLISIIFLCVKGLIITYKPSIIALFDNRKTSYSPLIIMMTLIIWIYVLYITN